MKKYLKLDMILRCYMKYRKIDFNFVILFIYYMFQVFSRSTEAIIIIFHMDQHVTFLKNTKSNSFNIKTFPLSDNIP